MVNRELFDFRNSAAASLVSLAFLLIFASSGECLAKRQWKPSLTGQLLANHMLNGLGQDGVFLGTFDLQPTLAVYFVSDGQPMQIRLRGAHDRLMVRLFDPDEKLTFWEFYRPKDVGDPTTIGSGEIARIPAEYRRGPAKLVPAKEMMLELSAQPGVHQLRIVSGEQGTKVSLAASREMPHGVCGQSDALKGWDRTIKELYFYVPPRSEKLEVLGKPGRFFDENNQPLTPEPGLELWTDEGHQQADLYPVHRTDVVWKL